MLIQGKINFYMHRKNFLETCLMKKFLYFYGFGFVQQQFGGIFFKTLKFKKEFLVLQVFFNGY